ncbi:indolepyruvate ferredoxin oxidoreductase beta subunit [Amorphus suaedae]
MNAMNRDIVDPPVDAAVIKLAILAIGGQGGGVVTDWVVATAERNGWVAQATSVPGVAQRTGATIYYVEMTRTDGRQPVLALSPSAGDIDIVVAAELMEAGRAVQRGFVTPDRTTLIASSHRAFGILEKSAPGDGIGDGGAVSGVLRNAARRLILDDMETVAQKSGSVISASLFGALAGSEALPFPRESYEETIRESGKGVAASLRAFAAGYDIARAPRDEAAADAPSGQAPAAFDAGPSGPSDLVDAYTRLLRRVDTEFASAARPMLLAGLQKVVDYQDIAYGADYLDRVADIARLDDASGGLDLTIAAAKYIANAMAYDDVIRVADLKTRKARFERVRAEARATDDQVLTITEYMHPRGEEVCGMLPARLGAAIEARPATLAWLDRRVNKGRRVRTDTVSWFVMLYLLGGMRRFRRGLLRHRHESAHMEAWLNTVRATVAQNYALAVEILKCRRLIKGYSDTHARGVSKYDRVLSAVPMLLDREDGADWLRRLREIALKDESGSGIDGALRMISELDRPVAAE